MTDIIPTVTREQLRQQKRGEEEKKKAEAARLLDEVCVGGRGGGRCVCVCV